MLYCFWLVVWNVVAGPLCFVFKNLNESWKKVDLLYSYKALSTVMICCAQTYLLLFLSFLFDSVCSYYQTSCLLFFSFLHFFQQSSKIGMQRVVTFFEWLAWCFFYSWLKFSKCCKWKDISLWFARLLIWEESYCETSTFSGLHGTCEVENPKLAFQDWSACWDSGEVQNSQLLNQAGESLCLLVKRMMMDKQFNLVGEGYDLY